MANKRLPSTQVHLDIEDIRDDTVILKNGTAAAVLQTTAINFDLLSETEQDSMIIAFAGLLNSLTFPIQILIRSKRMDVSNYLTRLEAAKREVRNQNLLKQIGKYENFVKDLVSKNQVLDKRFYVILPYFGIQLPQVTGPSVFLKKTPETSKWATLEKARGNLGPKVDHLVRQLAGIGIKSLRLNTEELVELFYDLYNPDVSREQKVALNTGEYTTPMVEPQIAPIIEQPSEEAK